MNQPEHVDLLVLGSGEGGKYLAWTMARAGWRVAVVERRYIGGSCPNTNCLPSKNEIWSAKVADLAHHADRFGMPASSAPADMVKVRARKREMVDGLIEVHLDNYRSSGAELIMGRGRFVAPKTIEVALNEGGTRTLSDDRVALNLGTHATIPDIPGLAAAEPLTNIEALELDRLPSHLIVIGGGYVGLELAQAFARYGSKVTVIEAGPQLTTREDPDVSGAIRELLEAEGITAHVDATVLGVEGRSGDGVVVRIGASDNRQIVTEGSDVLAALGRTPNTAGIGLDIAGVELDRRGFIAVDDRLRTSAPDVWALGECAGSPQFTHVSFDDFRVVRAGMTVGDRSTRNRLVPYCMFTDPPLARVGLSEREARDQGVAVRVARLPIAAVLRSRTVSETRGFMKALIAADSDDILGFAMVGVEAGEVMAVVQTAMLAGLPYTGLRDAILAHPTMAEGLNGLFANVPSR